MKKPIIALCMIGIFALLSLSVLGSNSTVNVLVDRRPDWAGGGDDPVDPGTWTTHGTDGGVKYAFVIGISDYEGGRNDLRYCDDDAIKWKDYLVSQGYFVLLLLDMAATADNIEAAINELNSLEDSASDEVIFTYSGHGGWYDDNYKSCIISADLMWFTNGLFAQLSDSFDSQNMFFFFDSCESGYFAEALDKSGRVICVGSGGPGYYTYDWSAFEAGVFSYYAQEATSFYDTAEEISEYAMFYFNEWAVSLGIATDSQFTDSYEGLLYI